MQKTNMRSVERAAKTGGALLGVMAGIKMLKSTVLKEIDVKNQYKGLALPAVAFLAADYIPIGPDFKFGAQLGAVVSLVGGVLDAMNMSKTKEQIGLAGDGATYQFRNMNEVIDFAKAQLPAPQTVNGRMEEPTRQAIPDGMEIVYPVAGEEDFATAGNQDW